MDKRKRGKIPLKRVPEPVEWLLRNASVMQLEFLKGLANSTQFFTFTNLIGKFKEYNVYEVFRYEAANEHDLAYFRAAKRGELAGLDAFILACQMAGEELTRRKKAKEVKI